MPATITKKTSVRERAARLFAKVRRRQLIHARGGNVRESYRYARRAERIRRAIGWTMLLGL